MQVEEKLMEYLNVLQMRILFCGKKKKKKKNANIEIFD